MKRKTTRALAPRPPTTFGPPPPPRRRRRVARNFAGKSVATNLLAQATPLIAGGLGSFAALTMAQRAGLSPIATAGLLTSAGVVGGSVVKDGALKSAANAAAGLGAGLIMLELLQQRGKQPQMQAPAQRQYATREEVQDAVRSELAAHQQQLAEQLAAFRNSYSPQPYDESAYYDDGRNADPITAEVHYGLDAERNYDEGGYDYDDGRNADPITAEVHHGSSGDERNWDYGGEDLEPRDADPIAFEIVHDDETGFRNADGSYTEAWHFDHDQHAA